MAQQTFEQDCDKKYIKIVLVGESGVGKSNIISRYVENKFSVGNNTTIGLEFSEKHVVVNGKDTVLQIWDTAGQERFRALNKTFYKNSLGALVIFDLADRDSFENLPRWIGELRDNLQETAVLLLVGNKSDIEEQKISVSEALELAKREQMGYLAASAAEGVNIREAFELLTRKIVQRVQEMNKFEMRTVQQKPMQLQPRPSKEVLVPPPAGKKCC